MLVSSARSALMIASFSGAAELAFAGDLGGDALKDFRGQARIDQDRHLRLAQHVDEAGRDDHAVRIDGALARRCAQRLPMAAILPSRMPTSPEYQGEPVPSMMWPLVMTRSKPVAWDCRYRQFSETVRVDSKTARIIFDIWAPLITVADSSLVGEARRE